MSETKSIDTISSECSTILLWYRVIAVQLFGKQITHYHKFYLLHEDYTYNRKFQGRLLKNNIPTIIIFLYLSIYGPDQYGFWVTQMHKVRRKHNEITHRRLRLIVNRGWNGCYRHGNYLVEYTISWRKIHSIRTNPVIWIISEKLDINWNGRKKMTIKNILFLKFYFLRYCLAMNKFVKVIPMLNINYAYI